MTPVVIGDATLYCADCRDVLPTLGRFDLLLTDPPYGIGADRGIGKVTKEGSNFSLAPKGWDDKPPEQDLLDGLVALCAQSIIWGGNYFRLPPSSSILIWDKVQPEAFSLAMAELAWSNLGRPAKIFRWKSMSINDGMAKHHPTQKPLGLMLWCLGQAGVSRSVFDPFMGSGTTGVACAQLGRKFTGIEREPKYFDIACKRIEQAYAQGRLFEPEQAKPEQGALL